MASSAVALGLGTMSTVSDFGFSSDWDPPSEEHAASVPAATAATTASANAALTVIDRTSFLSLGLARRVGDLAPLANLALPMIGAGEVLTDVGTEPAAGAMQRASITPLTLEADEELFRQAKESGGAPTWSFGRC